MARHNLATAEDETQAAAPQTIGELLPGIAKSVDGVNVHALPIGLLAALVEEGITAQRLKELKRHTIGMRKETDEVAFEAARKASVSAALAAFAAGVLPMDVTPEDSFVADAVTEWHRNVRDAQIRSAPDPEAAEAAWYAARMNEEEKKELATVPRSRARDNCVKRRAREWLASDALSEKAQAERAKLIAAGKSRAEAAFVGARARVAAMTEQLLTGTAPEPVAALAAAVEPSEDFGV